MACSATARRCAPPSTRCAALASAALPYAVVYGEGPARTTAALAALRPLLALAPPPDDAAADRPRLRARCRECLVPDCEHLRGAAPPAPR